jgi:hypothetical protein
MSTNLASTSSGYTVLYPHPSYTLWCQSFIYQPQTALCTLDLEKNKSFKYLAQISHVLSLSVPTAFCVLFKLPHICYIPRSIMSIDFYKLRILHYEIHHPNPSIVLCRVTAHSYAKIIRKQL